MKYIFDLEARFFDSIWRHNPFCRHDPLYLGVIVYGLLQPTTTVSSASTSDPSNYWTGPVDSLSNPSSQYSHVYFQVCREFQRGTCTRQPNECRYAHPPDSVALDTADSHVTVCMDFVKGKCSREACRYFHPPPHLQGQIKAQQQRPNATSVTTAAPTLVGNH